MQSKHMVLPLAIAVAMVFAGASSMAGGLLDPTSTEADATGPRDVWLDVPPTPDGVYARYYDPDGDLKVELGNVPDNPLLAFERHHIQYKAHKAKPDNPGNGGGGGGGGDGGGGTNDCTSDKYATGGWYWTSAWSATASSYASTLDSGGKAWDAETGASIFGGITSGSKGTAGVQDFVNQIDWVDLGSSSTVAVTTTWYYRGSGEAVESDQRYNTNYKWSTNGAADAMDVGHVGTHEIGHSFGLDHPNGPSSQIDCLTMYAYVDYGWTHGRTLGTGDILGIRSIYGA